MNLNKQIAEWENRIARSTKPWMRIVAAILLLGGTGLLVWHQGGVPFRKAGQGNPAASAHLGQVLQNAGVETQAGPSR
jgi:ABC-type nickel/cobalt efflux system permease component RcnA